MESNIKNLSVKERTAFDKAKSFRSLVTHGAGAYLRFL